MAKVGTKHPINALRLPQGLEIRPSTQADNHFIEKLYQSTRSDLQLIDAEADFIESIIDQQLHAQSNGYGDAFPNAMYFIVEKHQQPIGRVTIDFGSNEIRVVDIAFIPQARNKGFGEGVLKTLQYAAGKNCSPLALSVHCDNWAAKKLYAKLGFQIEESAPPYERLVWYPTLMEIRA
ncbi:GNAT family N-acetyltransferase [Motiliproteus sp. MSK22-1]|uniref:GNAT family N-acetyltransferase n=1 Tax=Motiliproteus sp. MSK22-1 TaxID=1897630 RepID=UPI000976AAF2|nr:GNAT family N-acetyltransferase [Motiliproteus sp. MSK22-1]OMH33803.1 GNAT family N-acetyltransferase [Motiliproteus sp. MSK22-1]